MTSLPYMVGSAKTSLPYMVGSAMTMGRAKIGNLWEASDSDTWLLSLFAFSCTSFNLLSALFLKWKHQFIAKPNVDMSSFI